MFRRTCCAVTKFRIREPVSEAYADQASQRAFQLPYVGSDAARNVFRDVVRNHDVLGLRLLLQDGDLGLEVRRLDVGNQAPLEPARRRSSIVGQLLRRAVAGDTSGCCIS